jgi:hypothetical protein
MSDADGVAAGSQPVEDYLDNLRLALSAPPREVRRMLAEVEVHQHDAAAEEIAAGKSRADAEAAAVARLGAVHEVAGRSAGFPMPTAALLRRTALASTLIGGVALVALGVSAAVAWAWPGCAARPGRGGAAAVFFAVRLYRLARPRAGRSDAASLPGWARPRSAAARPPTD